MKFSLKNNVCKRCIEEKDFQIQENNLSSQYEDPQAMKHNDLSPRSLVQLRDSSRSFLPSAGHVCLNGNKLSIEISCELFLNKQYQRHKYG